MTTSKSHGTLFVAAMVCAIIDCHKTQTRRILLPMTDPDDDPTKLTLTRLQEGYPDGTRAVFGDDTEPNLLSVKLIQPGDTLWVREAFQVYAGGTDDVLPSVTPQPTACTLGYKATDDRRAAQFGSPYTGPWRSARFMPRWASRLTLGVTETQVQRIAGISDADCLAEGVRSLGNEWVQKHFPDYHREHAAWLGLGGEGRPPLGPSPRQRFQKLWDSINGIPKEVLGPDKKPRHYVSYPFEGEARTETHRGRPHYVRPNPYVGAYTFTITEQRG
jgi:hypothetical protein